MRSNGHLEQDDVNGCQVLTLHGRRWKITERELGALRAGSGVVGTGAALWRLGCSYPTLRKYQRAGLFPGARRVFSRWVFPVAELNDVMAGTEGVAQ